MKNFAAPQASLAFSGKLLILPSRNIQLPSVAVQLRAPLLVVAGGVTPEPIVSVPVVVLPDMAPVGELVEPMEPGVVEGLVMGSGDDGALVASSTFLPQAPSASKADKASAVAAAGFNLDAYMSVFPFLNGFWLSSQPDFNLEAAVGCVRVRRNRRARQGETTQWATAHKAEQRGMVRRAWCNRTHSAVPQKVNAIEGGEVNGHAAFLKFVSGQLLLLGSM